VCALASAPCPIPFNANQISHISLRPEDVDAIVFWTRNPRPLLTALDELDARGYRYYFQYTILDNPRLLDPRTPPVDRRRRDLPAPCRPHRAGARDLALRPDRVEFGHGRQFSSGALRVDR
jgi:hypothetical protein